MNKDLENLKIDLKELEEDVRKNREERMKFVDFQAEWHRKKWMNDKQDSQIE